MEIVIKDKTIENLDANTLQFFLILKIIEANNAFCCLAQIRDFLQLSDIDTKLLLSNLRVKGWVLVPDVNSFLKWDIETSQIVLTEQEFSVKDILASDVSFQKFLANVEKEKAEILSLSEDSQIKHIFKQFFVDVSTINRKVNADFQQVYLT